MKSKEYQTMWLEFHKNMTLGEHICNIDIVELGSKFDSCAVLDGVKRGGGGDSRTWVGSVNGWRMASNGDWKMTNFE